MADNENKGPMPGFLNKGLGMLFGTKPKAGQTGGMAPPPARVVPAPATPTPEMLGTGLAANAATELQQRKNRTDAALRAAGAE